jgi:carbon-monoxide dehydrogenase medium subunit
VEENLMLQAFKYHRVDHAAEAVAILAAWPGEARIIAGGTDLLLQMQQENCGVRHLINLRRDASLAKIDLAGGEISLGANVTHRDVELSPVIRERLAALHEAVGQVGSVQIRNVATVAGNVCNASPAADTAGPLLALEAAARVLGSKGERTLALADFFKSPGQTALDPDEVLLRIVIPEPPAHSGSAYLKFGRRKALDLAIIGVAVYLECTPDKEQIAVARIALNAAAPRPMRAYWAEKFLRGAPLHEEWFALAAELAANDARPRTDLRATAAYRTDMLKIFVRRALAAAAGRAMADAL